MGEREEREERVNHADQNFGCWRRCQPTTHERERERERERH